MSLSIENRLFVERFGEKRLAMKLGVEPVTIRGWLADNGRPPPYANAAIMNVRNNRAPIDPIFFTLWENVALLDVSESTYFRWKASLAPPIAARHAMREMMMRKKEFRQHHADAFLLILRSRLRKWTDRSYHDPATGDTITALTFDTLAEMGLVHFSPKFKRVILTRKGRDRLNRWNARHD